MSGTDEYYYIPPEQCQDRDDFDGPMLVERMMLSVKDDEAVFSRLRREMHRIRQERGASVGLHITLAAVLPAVADEKNK